MAFVIFATAFPTFPRFYEWCRGRDDRFRGASMAPNDFARRPSNILTTDSAWDRIEDQGHVELKQIESIPRDWPLRDSAQPHHDFNGGITKTVDFGVTTELR